MGSRAEGRAGIHPQDADRLDWHDFETIWQDPRCLAVGECGLDRRYPDLKRQTEVFHAQADAAERLQKPLILHCVRTHDEIRKIALDRKPAVPWIIHGFRGKERTLFSLLDAGFYISFGGGLLKDAGNVEPYFQRIPRDRIFFETDADNGPDLRAVYALAASMYGVGINELCGIVRNNFRSVFAK